MIIMALSVLMPLTAMAQNIAIKKEVIGSGGAVVGYRTGDNLTFSGIAGQTAIDIKSGELTINGGGSADVTYYEGFWSPIFDVSSVKDSPKNPYGSSLSNYPNPVSHQTTIEYTIPGRSDVTLTIYDYNGRRIALLYDGLQDGGTHSIEWDVKNMNGVDVASGSYIYELKVEPASYAGYTFDAFSLRQLMVVQK